MIFSDKQQEINFTLLVLTFLVAPFYFHFNIGGLGFNLPYNVSTWLSALLFSAVIIMAQVKTRTVVFNRAFLYCLVFPIAVTLAGIASDVPQHIDWLFRQLYILGGFAFLFALFQARLTVKHVERLLYCLVIATLLQSIVAISQIFGLSFLENVTPYSVNKIPIGMLQQVNVLASYLVTGLVIILFLISRPSFYSANILSKALLVITFGLAVYIIFSTGSRVGLLSFFVAVGLIILSRWKQLIQHKKILLLLVTVTFIGILSAQAGILRALDKTEQLTEGEYASARQTIYAIAGDLIANKPFFGYGIGSFQRVWVDQVAKFSAKHPGALIPQGTVSHPHNEVLLWMIEGGLVSLFALLVILIAICHALYQCGFSRGGAYTALLLPITLHTQVELPFYISSVHWFLWLFLIFMVFRHQLKTTHFSISQTAYYSIQMGILVVSLMGGAIIVHASVAQLEVAKYSSGKDGGGNISVGLHDLYFNSYAEKLMMQTLLYTSIEQKNKTHMSTFIPWAEDRISYKPEQGMFIMLSDAYGFNDDKINQCRVAKRGLATYTKNEQLQSTVDSCD
ncbi:MAG: Wzy polymerase domain-containing protein [Methylococcales bacterium]